MKTSSKPLLFALPVAVIAAFLSLPGCSPQQPESSPAPPAETAAPAPSAPPAPMKKAAQPNSFYEVQSRLDQGGSLYGYLSTERWLEGLSGKAGGLLGEFVNAFDVPPEEHASVEKGGAVAVRFLEQCGIEEISGVGMSSFAVADDLHRSKLILHHYPDRGNGFIWSLFGGEPAELEGRRLLPANTVIGSSSRFDLPGLWATLEAEVQAAGYPQANQSLTQFKGIFMAGAGIDFDQFLTSLGGEYGLAITLDDNVQVPIPGKPGATIPRPDVLLFIQVNDDTLYNSILQLAKAQKMPLQEGTVEGAQSASMPVPLPIAAQYTATLASTDGLLLLGSSPAIVKEALDVRAGNQPGLAGSEEFQHLASELPERANSFTFVSKRFGQVYLDLNAQILSAEQDEEMPADLMKGLMEKLSPPTASLSLFENTGEGWVWTSHSTQDTSAAVVASAVVAPVALLAAIAIPNFVKARATAQKNTCIANLKQIDGAKQQWAIENKKSADAVPTEADLFGPAKFVKFKPVCPLGGNYTLGTVRDTPTCSLGDSDDHTLD